VREAVPNSESYVQPTPTPMQVVKPAESQRQERAVYPWGGQKHLSPAQDVRQ